MFISLLVRRGPTAETWCNMPNRLAQKVGFRSENEVYSLMGKILGVGLKGFDPPPPHQFV